MNEKERKLLQSVKNKITNLAKKEQLVKLLRKLLEQSPNRGKFDKLLVQLDKRLTELQKHADAAFPPGGKKKKKPNLP